MALRRISKKVLPNKYARESETVGERAYWLDAKDAAEQLLAYARVAKAYHFEEELEGCTVGPVSTDIRKLALRLYDAEQVAIALRVARAERRKQGGNNEEVTRSR